MRRADGQTLDEALAYESHIQEIAGRSQDSKEGVQAFIDKREPEFKGK
jgi:2-(1,2-epoxy-1,2-dihydrophenyl)acetyl-CoA isomerase